METQSSVTVPTILRVQPTLDAYIPLAEHQSRTPATFFGGPPVLHFHSTHARAYVSTEHQAKLPWTSAAATQNDTAVASADGAGELIWPRIGDDMVCQAVNVFVGSESLTLYSPDTGCGLALPYPVIGLHAIKTAETADGRHVPTVYMQLGLDSGNGDGGEEEEDTVELLLVLPLEVPSAGTSDTNGDAPPEPVSKASALFEAISACADLHPDRFGGDDDDDDDDDGYPSFFRVANGDGEYDDGEYDEDEDDGILVDGADGLQPIDGFRGVYRPTDVSGGDGPVTTAAAAAATDLPPPMPGSGGWITAENAHEFFDEEGNWRGRGGNLGGGAGRVRGRDELEGEAPTAEAASTDEAAEGRAQTTSETKTATPAAVDGPPGEGQANGGGEGSESKRVRTE